MLDSYKKLTDEAERAARKIEDNIRKGSRFAVGCHFDADGLAAAGILAKALHRASASFHLRVLKQLDPQDIEFFSKSESESVILADIGSGYLDLLKNLASAKDVFVLDHHQINGENYGRLTHVNPHLSNLDGGKEVSGAGVSYVVTKALDQRNIDLSSLAVVGAVGDMQDKDEGRTLRGFNSLIVEDAIKSGVLKVETDLIIYGRETRPIHKALSHTVNPFLPGLSGQEDNCFALLSSLSIPIKVGDRWRTVVELSSDEKKKILSAIVEKITSSGLSGAVVMNLIGSVYTLLGEENWTPTRDAREYATLLNSCGRMGHPSIAIAVCMGERGPTIAEANKILSEHRKALATYMSLITENPSSVESLGRLSVIHGEEYLNENMTGAVSSLLSSSETFAPDKAIIVCAKTRNGEIKISARATMKMVEKGVNLGNSLQHTAKKYGGIGGGHKVAAGAQIPEQRLKEFLKELSDELSRLLG
jgi:single-stranded-DNA-specific exonuclease